MNDDDEKIVNYIGRYVSCVPLALLAYAIIYFLGIFINDILFSLFFYSSDKLNPGIITEIEEIAFSFLILGSVFYASAYALYTVLYIFLPTNKAKFQLFVTLSIIGVILSIVISFFAFFAADVDLRIIITGILYILSFIISPFTAYNDHK